MIFPAFNTIRALQRPLDKYNEVNCYGETPLAFAPRIRFDGGSSAVPQQYLDVQRTLENLENVLADIDVPEGFLLFAGQEEQTLYLVAAVFGEENYPRGLSSARQDKIVYGRRWLIEPTTTTSEVVQTAMLAVKKAREHELREKFSLSINQGLNKTTPFNCHQDLPLMVKSQESLLEPSNSLTEGNIIDVLKSVRIEGLELKFRAMIELGERRIVDVLVAQQDKKMAFAELNGRALTVVCEEQSIEHFLHQLFNTCLQLVDRFVEENIRFKGFSRFSHDVSPVAIAEFSYLTRNVTAKDPRFDEQFEDMSYRVDSAKAPTISLQRLGDQQREVLAQYPSLAGYCPHEPTECG